MDGSHACAGRADEDHAHSISCIDRLYTALFLLELPDTFLEVGDLCFEVVHGLIRNWSHSKGGKLEEGLTKASKSCARRTGAL